jgi:hypothetical protein
MTDGAQLRRVEERLRAAGPSATPPGGYAEIARAAALGEVPHQAPARAKVIRLPGSGSFSAIRAALAAAVIAVSVAGALIIGVGGSDPMRVEHSVSLSGDGGATGSVDIAEANGPVRDLVVRIEGLEPAPEGRYYEMWFSHNGDVMAVVAFNTSREGKVEVRSAMPAGIGWESCWVTLEGGAEDVPATVLRAS